MSNGTPHPLAFSQEPVAWMGAIQAGVALAMGFGLNITSVQQALIQTFVAAVLTVVLRTQVTPVTPAAPPKP